MKISIVTISYNQVAYLKECIDSVLSQNIPLLEYIVVDPGSTDGSRDLIESYGSKIIKVFEKDNGPAQGLNHGFARSTGDILGFINADDYFLPNALSNVEKYFSMNGSKQFISGTGIRIVMNQGSIKITPTKLTITKFLYGACNIFQQGTFFPAFMYREVGGFNEKNFTCWDAELFGNFLKRGFCHEILNKELAVFRIHDASISGSGRLSRKYLEDHRRIFQKLSGRPFGWIDLIISIFLRAKKYLTNLIKRHP